MVGNFVHLEMLFGSISFTPLLTRGTFCLSVGLGVGIFVNGGDSLTLLVWERSFC